MTWCVKDWNPRMLAPNAMNMATPINTILFVHAIYYMAYFIQSPVSLSPSFMKFAITQLLAYLCWLFNTSTLQVFSSIYLGMENMLDPLTKHAMILHLHESSMHRTLSKLPIDFFTLCLKLLRIVRFANTIHRSWLERNTLPTYTSVPQKKGPCDIGCSSVIARTDGVLWDDVDSWLVSIFETAALITLNGSSTKQTLIVSTISTEMTIVVSITSTGLTVTISYTLVGLTLVASSIATMSSTPQSPSHMDTLNALAFSSRSKRSTVGWHIDSVGPSRWIELSTAMFWARPYIACYHGVVDTNSGTLHICSYTSANDRSLSFVIYIGRELYAKSYRTLMMRLNLDWLTLVTLYNHSNNWIYETLRGMSMPFEWPSTYVLLISSHVTPYLINKLFSTSILIEHEEEKKWISFNFHQPSDTILEMLSL